MAVSFIQSGISFPDAQQADDSIGGLLAVGGDLSPKRLLAAYRAGIFPWFDDDQAPILWWSPDPRAVLVPGEMRISRSLAKRLRNGGFEVSFDRAFAEVVEGCATEREGQSGTWITPAMGVAYGRLRELGYAHSLEVWREGHLVGGLYGLSIGAFFFGESMFSRAADASKVALAHLSEQLKRWRFQLIDCQIPNQHLGSLGVKSIPRAEFLAALAANDESKTRLGAWAFDADYCAG
ncbi:MAG: leucyl/phenylalanyl-tRNA--protein transferase [Gammaproteobacteria bacterium]|nr:leucyl/phenylalanyl-tRNA--protein transferase [Gammaproteobacteria bacterium]